MQATSSCFLHCFPFLTAWHLFLNTFSFLFFAGQPWSMWAETARSGTAPLAMGTGEEHRGQTGTWRTQIILGWMFLTNLYILLVLPRTGMIVVQEVVFAEKAGTGITPEKK